MLNNKVC